MGSIAIEIASKDDTITIRPHYKGERFPKFDEVEIDKDGNVRGWAGITQPSTVKLQELGRYFSEQTGRPYVKVERWDELTVVLKRIS